jgi:peptide/nickel transport system substrate-binding protein
MFKMKKLRWQLLIVVVALVAIGILLLSQQQSTVLPKLGIAQPTPEPVRGGSYSEALIGSFGRLNPLFDQYNPADRDVDQLLFSGLIRFDDRGNPHPDLADSWGISQDGTVYNFSIRPNAVWHDGKPVTSDDIIFTVDLMRNEKVPVPADLRDFWKQVTVTKLNDQLIQFTLPEAFSPFLDYLSFGVLPKHLLSDVPPDQLASDPFNSKPVGTGPYRFDNLLVENGQIQGVALAAFDKYYGNVPYIDTVTFKYSPDSASALEAFKKKDVMGISQITPAVLEDAFTSPGLNTYTSQLPRLGLVYLNLANPDTPYFKDASLRRALLMGINRQRIVDRVFEGQAIQADGPFLPGSWAYYDGIEHIDYNPDAAVAALKQAGYTIPASGGNVRSKDGQELAFEMVYPDQAPYKVVAEQIQMDWEQLGVKVTLKAVPYDKLLTDYLEPRSYQAALVDLNMTRSNDPDPYPFWHQAQITNGQNYSGWDDRQASEYLEQARVLVDPAERLKRYRNFQVRFTTEMPALPLFYSVYTYGVDSQVQGVGTGPLVDPSERFMNIASWNLLSQRPTQAAPVPQSATSIPTPIK